MKPLAKGLLAGCVVLVVLGGIVVVLALRWVGANKERLRVEANKVREEGREYGRSAVAPACVTKAFETYRGDPSILGEARARIWLTGCLETTAPESALCAAVPATSEIVRTVSWRLGECSRLGFDGDKGCTRILQEVQRHCEGRGRR